MTGLNFGSLLKNLTNITNSTSQNTSVAESFVAQNENEIIISNSNSNTDTLSFYKEPTDEEISAKNINVSADNSNNYKGLADKIIKQIKQTIWDLKHKSAPEPEPTVEPSEEPSPEITEEPSTEPEPSVEPEPTGEQDTIGPEKPNEEEIDYTLTRRSSSAVQTINNIGTEGIIVQLANTFAGEEYYYKISSNIDSFVSATLKYLDNGRLMIIGDDLKIEAIDGQDDDIVLCGSRCYLDTNSGNDRIRIADSQDSNYTYVASYNNEIHAGSGDDYIQDYGFTNNIYGEKGTDSCIPSSSTISSIEENFQDFYDFKTKNISDSKLGWASQGGYGDCTLMSVLNSLEYYLDKNNIPLSDYVQISKSGTTYNVKFTKSGEKVSVTKGELEEMNNADGDVDNVIIEVAFRKMISDRNRNNGKSYNMNNNGDPTYSISSSQNMWLISKYLYGREASAEMNTLIGSYDTTYFRLAFADLMQAYLDGEISNLVVYTNNDENIELGICYGHAYAIRGGVVGEYVTLTNPWDNKDSFRLDWDEFFTYYQGMRMYGDAAKYALKQNYPYLYYADSQTFRLYDAATISPRGEELLQSIIVGTDNNEITDGISNIFSQLYNDTENKIGKDIIETEKTINKIIDVVTENSNKVEFLS